MARISNYVDQNKMRVLMKAFIESQFGYCPLIWMFHSRKLNNRINRIHERALRLVYKDNLSTYDELLKKDNSFSIHHRNIQILAMEMYKVKHGLCPTSISDLFPLKNNRYNLRS